MGLVQSRGQGLVQAGTVGRARLSRPVEHRIRFDPGHDMAPGLRLLVDVRAPGLALVLVLMTVPALGLGEKTSSSLGASSRRADRFLERFKTSRSRTTTTDRSLPYQPFFTAPRAQSTIRRSC